MPKKIVVAIDGSNHAWRALDLAADMAKAHGASLLLLHVVGDRELSDDERRLVEVEHLAALRRDSELGRLIDNRGDAELVVPRVLARLHDAETAALAAIGQRLLDEARERARAKAAKIEDAVLGSGEPAHVIVDTTHERGADQIVMGARGRGGVSGLILGSVSQKVIHLADCPVTVVK